MTTAPPSEPPRRKFTADELCDWLQVPPEPLPEPGHVMSRAEFERIEKQKYQPKGTP